jgi:hypothetical protein
MTLKMFTPQTARSEQRAEKWGLQSQSITRAFLTCRFDAGTRNSTSVTVIAVIRQSENAGERGPDSRCDADWVGCRFVCPRDTALVSMALLVVGGENK